MFIIGLDRTRPNTEHGNWEPSAALSPCFFLPPFLQVLGLGCACLCFPAKSTRTRDLTIPCQPASQPTSQSGQDRQDRHIHTACGTRLDWTQLDGTSYIYHVNEPIRHDCGISPLFSEQTVQSGRFLSSRVRVLRRKILAVFSLSLSLS